MVFSLPRGSLYVRRLLCSVSGWRVSAPNVRCARQAQKPEVPERPMTVQLQALAITVFAVVMAAAAFEDFRRLVIPNLLPILLCAVWPLYLVATGPSMTDALGDIGCALAVF